LNRFDRAWSGVATVFDAGHTGLKRRDDAFLVVGMCCDFSTHACSGQNHFLEFVHFHLLAGSCLAVGQYATRRCDLYEVRTVLDDVAGRAAAIVGSVTNIGGGEHFHEVRVHSTNVHMTTRDANTTRSNDAWAVYPTLLDGVAHGIHFLLRRPDVADRRKPGPQCIHREKNTAHLHQWIRHFQGFAVVLGAEFALQMHVHVHQTGKNELLTEIDHGDVAVEISGAGVAIFDGDNSTVLNDDSLSCGGRLAGHSQQLSCMDQGGVGNSRHRERQQD